MDVILISFVICFFGVMVTVLLFTIAMRPTDEEEPEAPKEKPAPSEGFFMKDRTDEGGSPGASSDSLLAKLHRHVRSEHEAAEKFLKGPSLDSLHAPSESSLWH